MFSLLAKTPVFARMVEVFSLWEGSDVLPLAPKVGAQVAEHVPHHISHISHFEHDPERPGATICFRSWQKCPFWLEWSKFSLCGRGLTFYHRPQKLGPKWLNMCPTTYHTLSRIQRGQVRRCVFTLGKNARFCSNGRSFLFVGGV